VARELEKRISRDTGQESTGKRRRHQTRAGASAEDKEQVHTTHLFDPTMLMRVKPHDLVASLLDRLRLSQQAARIIAASLGRPGTTRCGPAEIFREPDRHGLDSAREIRAGRRRD